METKAKTNESAAKINEGPMIIRKNHKARK
jgi:hypothetical protein